MTSDDLLRCSFCAKSQKEVARLIAGPGVYICDEDVARAEKMHGPSESACSFCDKAEVEWMYSAGPPASRYVGICNGCVKLCREIMDEGPVMQGERVEVHMEASTSTVLGASPVTGARCATCRAVLAESARTQVVDVQSDGDGAGARVLFVYCSSCGTMIDDVIVPEDFDPES
jgi:hypothetical protein